MSTSFRLVTLVVGVFAAACFSSGAQAAYSFTDVNGGGSISGAYPAFTITGSDNGNGADSARYTQIFTAAETVSFAWSYATQDCCGGYWDPAGYTLNGSEIQLSTDGVAGQGSSGTFSVAVNAGDTFGWYVDSIDSVAGPAELTVTIAGAVPEPASVLLLMAGLATVGFSSRRRRTE